jgi:hypothetical protein
MKANTMTTNTDYNKLIAEGYKALRQAARTGQGFDYAMLAAPLIRVEKAIRELQSAVEHGPYGNVKPAIQARAGHLINEFRQVKVE